MKLEDSKDMAEMEDIVESGYRIMMSDKLRATDSSGASCTSEAFGTSVKPFEEGFEEALEEALDAVPSLEESLDEKCPLCARCTHWSPPLAWAPCCAQPSRRSPPTRPTSPISTWCLTILQTVPQRVQI
jgi:hypothetical protein